MKTPSGADFLVCQLAGRFDAVLWQQYGGRELQTGQVVAVCDSLTDLQLLIGILKRADPQSQQES